MIIANVKNNRRVLGKIITLKIYIFLTVLNNRFFKEKEVWGGRKPRTRDYISSEWGGGGRHRRCGGGRTRDYISSDREGGGGGTKRGAAFIFNFF
jgi:hypothetical protein